jgi:hypothetical protein
MRKFHLPIYNVIIKFEVFSLVELAKLKAPFRLAKSLYPLLWQH